MRAVAMGPVAMGHGSITFREIRMKYRVRSEDIGFIIVCDKIPIGTISIPIAFSPLV